MSRTPCHRITICIRHRLNGPDRRAGGELTADCGVAGAETGRAAPS